MFLQSCDVKKQCEIGFQSYKIYAYATPEQRFVFFVGQSGRPIDFYEEGSSSFTREVDSSYYAHSGRSIGVEAIVCGRIENYENPISPNKKSIYIRSYRKIREVDMTELIEKYYRSIGTPGY